MTSRNAVLLIFLLLVCEACRLTRSERVMNRGVARTYKEKFEKAIRLFNKAIRLDSANLEAFLNRGTAYNDIGEPYNALLDYRRLLSKNYNNPDLYYNMALNFYDLENLDSSLFYHNKALSVDSTDIDFHIGKGTTLTDMKRYSEALSSFAKARFINPLDVTAIKDIGYLYYDMGDFENAKKYILLAIDNGLKETYYYTLLAQIYVRNNDQRLACEYYHLAKKHLPKGDTLADIDKLECVLKK